MAPMQEHPFAPYLRIIAKGPTLSRPLTQAEAREAMALVLAGDVTEEQLGAFLLLLRYRGETAGEIAGFVEAAGDALQDTLRKNCSGPPPDLDWPSYADRHRQQPWFVLSALLLAQNGVRVLMHGITGEHEGYAPTRPVLQVLGIPVSGSVQDAVAGMNKTGLGYMGLESFMPVIDNLFALRPVLGVRTVVNTFARAINPLKAPHQMQGVVHPPYRTTHGDVALLLRQPAAVVFKGGGGEAQRNPLKVCRTLNIRQGKTVEEAWPTMNPESLSCSRPESGPDSGPLDPVRVLALWRGEMAAPVTETAVAEATVIATTAVALRLLGRATSLSEADSMATEMWRKRKKEQIL